MKALGVDYSSTNTGLCILDEKGKVDSYTLLSYKNKSFDERILLLWEDINSFLSKQNQELIITIEAPAFMGKGRTSDLSAGFGYLKYSLLAMGYTVLTIPPTTLKKFVTGKGKLDKSKDKRLKHDELFNLLPKAFKRELELSSYKKLDDIIDSYWLAKYGYTQKLS